jgi:hypothetical protein
MADISDFRPLLEAEGVKDTRWSITAPENETHRPFHPEGWAPMVYYNSYNAGVDSTQRKEMTFLVCTEWRVRFDLANPACASHTHHGVTDDRAWDTHIKKAVALLPGVIDITEKVLTAGVGLAAKYTAATAP